MAMVYNVMLYNSDSVLGLALVSATGESPVTVPRPACVCNQFQEVSRYRFNISS